jgi:hypothetical protein
MPKVVRGIMERYWKTHETRSHQALSGTTPSKSNQQKLISSNLYLLKYKKVKHANDLFTEFRLAAKLIGSTLVFRVYRK